MEILLMPRGRTRGAALWLLLLLLVGGPQAHAQTLPALAPTAHRGFPRDTLVYRPADDTWGHAGDVPFSLVTTTLTVWRGQVVVPGEKHRARNNQSLTYPICPNCSPNTALNVRSATYYIAQVPERCWKCGQPIRVFGSRSCPR